MHLGPVLWVRIRMDPYGMDLAFLDPDLDCIRIGNAYLVPKCFMTYQYLPKVYFSCKKSFRLLVTAEAD
jgi:hypothetical protein